jgi:hypothetical protein
MLSSRIRKKPMIQSIRPQSSRRPGRLAGFPRAAAAVWVSTALVATPTPAPRRSAGDTYMAYSDAAASVRSLTELRPFLPKAMAEMLSRLPRDMQLKMLEQSRVQSAARIRVLKEIPLGSATIVEMEGLRSGKPVRGWAKMIVEDGEFKVLKDDWSGSPTPAPPKIPANVSGTGKASGELAVNGVTARLQHALARALPDPSDPARLSYQITLSDAPWSPKDGQTADRIRAGTLHLVRVTIGPDRQVRRIKLFHRGLENGVLDGAAGIQVFEADRFGPDIVSGRIYMEAPESSGNQTYYYAATFKAVVEQS